MLLALLALRAPPRLAVCDECTARARPPRLSVSNERATARLQARIASLDPQACLLIDVENLRGLSGFRVSHGTVIAALACLTREWELTGRVVLAVDHGDEQCGFYNTQLGLAFVFAGPRQKADDVLVRLDVKAFAAALFVKVGLFVLGFVQGRVFVCWCGVCVGVVCVGVVCVCMCGS